MNRAGPQPARRRVLTASQLPVDTHVSITCKCTQVMQRPYRPHHQHVQHRRRREHAMDQICLVVPVLPGRTADARDFMRELEGDRKAAYQHSERRIGIVKEAWYLARTPAGDQLVAYMESPDFPTALSMFSQSHD